MHIDFKFIIIYCFIFGIIESINNYIHKKIQEREGRKASYDCFKCKAWDCPAKKCLKESNKLDHIYNNLNK